jgi:putative transposase
MGQALHQVRCHLYPQIEEEPSRLGDTFYIDEVFVKINGKQHYLWRAVDQDGEVVDVYLQAKRDGVAAKRFFKRLLRSHGSEPRKIVTDNLRSYGVAHRELIPETIHSSDRYENNRAEQSQSLPRFIGYEATRVRERGMRRFKSVGQAQRFLGAHAAVSNLFNLGRHLIRAQHYRDLRISAFGEWSRAVA